MTLFAIFFLLIYTLMHLLVWLGVRSLVPDDRRLRTGLAAFGALMIAAPLLTRLLERADVELAARAMAWLGYLWMGFVWLAFALFTAQGLWNGSMWLAGRYRPSLRNWLLGGRRSALLALAAVAVAGLWAFFEAGDLRVERITLRIANLPVERSPLRIVQISDLHLGLINRKAMLDKVIGQVQHLQPDLLVATGDLLDAQRHHLDGLSEPWRILDPPLGKFAVTGNHEAYAGRDNALEYLQAAGFRVLSNELVTAGPVQIAGVPDPAWGEQQGDGPVLAAAAPQQPLVFLKHRPWVEAEARGRFTLQLSGHAHRGQIFPFNLLTGLAYPMQDGLYRLDGGGWLYTSRGTGSWGPPMRLFSPPEITLIELIAENAP